jgi:hypothetical protein
MRSFYTVGKEGRVVNAEQASVTFDGEKIVVTGPDGFEARSHGLTLTEIVPWNDAVLACYVDTNDEGGSFVEELFPAALLRVTYYVCGRGRPFFVGLVDYELPAHLACGNAYYARAVPGHVDAVIPLPAQLSDLTLGDTGSGSVAMPRGEWVTKVLAHHDEHEAMRERVAAASAVARPAQESAAA